MHERKNRDYVKRLVACDPSDGHSSHSSDHFRGNITARIRSATWNKRLPGTATGRLKSPI